MGSHGLCADMQAALARGQSVQQPRRIALVVGARGERGGVCLGTLPQKKPDSTRRLTGVAWRLSMRRYWRKIRYQFEWLGLVVFTTVIPLLPRRAVVALSRMLGKVVFFFDRNGRAVALANIGAAFGDEYTPNDRIRIAQASYCNLSRTMCDLLWSPALTQQNFHRYLKVENVEVLQRLQARGEGAVAVCIHQGNFEWASLATGFHGIKVTIVTERFKNPWVGGFFRRCREVSGHSIIPQKSSMIRLLKHVRRGGVAGLLTDLNRHPTEAATVIDALGMKMCVTLLQAVLVQWGGARLVP